MTPPAETTVEVKLLDYPKLQALLKFATDVEAIAVERSDGELLTRVRRLSEELKADEEAQA